MSSNDTAKTIPKMRTFAADLTATRASSKTVNPRPTPPTVTISTKPKKEKDAIIPPFHTFANAQKEISVPPVAKPVSTPTLVTTSEAQKIISRSSDLSRTTQEALPAVIITDTKRKRFSLTSALATSMRNWWNTKKVEAKKRKQPKYTVASADRRRGVIQKATSKTGRESTADHQAVITRIKAAKQIPHTQNAVVIMKTSTTPKILNTPTWETSTDVEPKMTTPNPGLVTQKIQQTQMGYPQAIPPLATAIPTIPKIKSLPPLKPIITPKKDTLVPIVPSRPSVTTVPAPIEISIPVVPVSIPPLVLQRKIEPIIPIKVSLATPPPIVTPAALPITEPEALVMKPAVLTPTEDAAVSAYPSVFQSEYTDLQTIREIKPVNERRFAQPKKPRRLFVDLFTQTNQLVYISFGVLLFTVVTGLGLRSYLQRSNPLQNEPIITTELNTTFETSTVTATPYTVYNPADLFTELNNKKSITDELFEITFVSPVTNGIVSPAEFFSYINASVLFDFKETTSGITFGGYKGTAWITLSVFDKNTALGGMLQWESTIASNLAPVFENRTASNQTIFSDSIISGNDVRILKNINDEEILVYGFINETTIVITKNTSTFMVLATNFSTR